MLLNNVTINEATNFNDFFNKYERSYFIYYVLLLFFCNFIININKVIFLAKLTERIHMKSFNLSILYDIIYSFLLK